MRKLSAKDDHSNHDRWLLTYADMITLLMAFFVMMYSMSVVNLSKFKEAAVSIRKGFGATAKGQGKSILTGSGRDAHALSSREVLGLSSDPIRSLVSYVRSNAQTDAAVKVAEDRRGVVITILSDRMLYGSASADVMSGAYPVLDRVAETLDNIENLVRIEGHTCDLPPRDSKYETNWELSTARATNVLRYLVERKGLNQDRFSAAGYGSVKPICPNSSAANRHRNRRVEIVILRPELSEVAPASSSAVWPPAEIRRSDN